VRRVELRTRFSRAGVAILLGRWVGANCQVYRLCYEAQEFLHPLPTRYDADIHKFDVELSRSPDLQARLAYARAWYAHQDESGRWCFGPSKFVGYEGISAKAYLQTAEESDGRRTEAQLQMWFGAVDPASALYQELSTALFALLAKYGKAPSTKMFLERIAKHRLLGNCLRASIESC